MLFSVITITFNAEKFLENTLVSVASQVGSSWEHLLWDGGSQDKTLEIAQAFDTVTILKGKDKGIADAMNKAALHAKGEYLIYLHADDLFAHPQSLLMIERTLRLHPWVKWLYGRAHIIDQKGAIIGTTPYETFSQKRLRKYNFITHPAVAVSRALFHEVGGFQENLRYCMDYDLWLRLCALSQPFAIPALLACFRQHDQSLSTSEPLRVADEAYRVRNCYLTSYYERFRSYKTWKRRRRQIDI